MTSGYGLTCESGDLYTRKCYDSQGHEVIGYTEKGEPIGFDDKTGKTYLTALNQQGQSYEPYGDAGVPYTAADAGPLSSVLGSWLPASGADPQAFTRLMTLPGAAARVKAATTVVPWHWNVFGLRKAPLTVGQESVTMSSESVPEVEGEKGVFQTLTERFTSQNPSGRSRFQAPFKTVGLAVGVALVVGSVLNR